MSPKTCHSHLGYNFGTCWSWSVLLLDFAINLQRYLLSYYDIGIVGNLLQNPTIKHFKNWYFDHLYFTRKCSDNHSSHSILPCEIQNVTIRKKIFDATQLYSYCSNTVLQDIKHLVKWLIESEQHELLNILCAECVEGFRSFAVGLQ